MQILPLRVNSSAMKKILPPLVFSISFLTAFSQGDHLPIGFSQEELQQMEITKTVPPVFYSQYGITNPPNQPVRTMAEWEEIQALAITWTDYQSMHKEIIKAAQKECQVYIVCSASSGYDSASIKTSLTSAGIPLTNLHFTIAPYNSVWIRDYGPNSCYMNDVDSLILVDWKYNRPTRPKDDTVSSVIARDLKIPIYLMAQVPANELIATGGNWMSDGLGNAFGSNLTVTENPGKTVTQIDQLANAFMGINRYTHMTVLPYDGIHHIDMHMKLLDEETLLVGQYPNGISDGPQIEANIQYILSTYNSVFGTPYKIIRIPQPPDQTNKYPNSGGDYLTYANASFVNKTIIVPQYYAKYDTTALRIWREACPGYNVVGINSNLSIPASGALHCITHEIGVKYPLFISHQALPNTNNCSSPYTVNARIQHKTGIANAKVWWTTDTTKPYQSANMTNTSIPNHTWSADIPAQGASTEVFYYIEATSVSGKTMMRPMPAPKAYWKFKVTCLTVVEETTPPVINPVYPNPSKGITCIPVFSLTESEGKISLVDVFGNEVRIIHEGKIPAGEKNFFLNTSDIAAGTYVVMIATPQGTRAQRLIVR